MRRWIVRRDCGDDLGTEIIGEVQAISEESIFITPKSSETLFHTIHFPTAACADEYKAKLKELGFDEITVGPTISVDEVKRRRFGTK